MNRQQRERFFKRIEAKYSISVDLKQDPHHYNAIREMDIFNAVKTIANIMMLPESYSIEYPTPAHSNIGHVEVREPWGPTVTFQYKSKLPPDQYQLNGKQYATTPTSGDPNLITQVESQLKSTLGAYIYNVGTDYKGNGVYEVTITTKR